MRRRTDPTPRRPRRAGAAVGTLLAAAALVAGGWFASTLFVSPAQREAAAAPPASVPVLAPVERGALASEVTFTVDKSRSHRQEVALPAASGVSVVTNRPVTRGDDISSAEVISEVNGRPVVALAGGFPFYRDLAKDDEGPDVRQLQSALAGAGYDIAITGEFTDDTADALKRLYRNLGYPAPKGGMPVSETFVARLPATIVSAPAVGALVADGATVVLESGTPVGRTSVPPAVGATLAKGMKGTVLGEKTPATIAGVKADADDPSADAAVTVTVAFGDADTLTLRFETERITEDAWIVPATAVAMSGERASVVRVRGGQASATAVAVPVTVIGTLNGRTAIAPVNDADLAEGDQVAIP